MVCEDGLPEFEACRQERLKLSQIRPRVVILERRRRKCRAHASCGEWPVTRLSHTPVSSTIHQRFTTAALRYPSLHTLVLRGLDRSKFASGQLHHTAMTSVASLALSGSSRPLSHLARCKHLIISHPAHACCVYLDDMLR